MDKIEKIRQEIERLYYNEAEKDESILAADAYKNALDAVEKFIDSLQQEQPEVDLEKEVDACWQNWLSPSNQKEVEGVLPKTEFAMYARHFYELGKKDSLETKEKEQPDKSMEKQREDIAASAASQWARCYKCDGIVNETGNKCKKIDGTCWKYFDAYKGALIALETLERWQKRKDNAKDKK